MIVKEKGLLRLMKEAYRGSGYTVMVDRVAGEDHLCVSHWGWKAGIEMTAVPRKILGLLVEHIGKLPKYGEAFKVQKAAVQTELFDVAKDPFKDLVQCMDYWESHKLMKRTRLEWNGLQVWQAVKDQSIVLMNPGLIDIADYADSAFEIKLSGTMLMIQGERSFAAVVKEFVDDGEKPLLENLTNVQWVQ